MTKRVSEFVTAPTGDLIPVGSFYGKTFYTSSQLKIKFVKALAKSGRAAPVASQIANLVMDGTITPVYKSKSILKSIFKLQPVEFGGIAGAAIPGKNIIFIFVETTANLFSFSNNDALAKTTLHELIHLLSFEKPSVFYGMFKEDLKDFYTFYFCRLLNCDKSKLNNQKVGEFVDFVYKKIEGRKQFIIDNALLKEYYNQIFDTFKIGSSLSSEQYTKLVTEYIVTLKLIMKLESYGKGHHIIKVAMAYKHIISPFYIAYKSVFGVDPLSQNQFVYQEMFAPSEVICIQTIEKTPSQKIYQAIKKL